MCPECHAYKIVALEPVRVQGIGHPVYSGDQQKVRHLFLSPGKIFCLSPVHHYSIVFLCLIGYQLQMHRRYGGDQSLKVGFSGSLSACDGVLLSSARQRLLKPYHQPAINLAVCYTLWPHFSGLTPLSSGPTKTFMLIGHFSFISNTFYSILTPTIAIIIYWTNPLSA